MLGLKDRFGLAKNLVVGLLIGGLFGFIQFVGIRDELNSLPVSSQFRYIAITWYSYALVGLIAVVLIIALTSVWTRVTQRDIAAWMWPPAVSVATVFGAGVITIETCETLFLAALASIVVFFVSCWLVHRWQQLRNGAMWALANMVALLGVLGWTLSTKAVGHGASWPDTLTVVPIIAISGIGLWILTDHKVNPRTRTLAYSLPMVALGMTLFAQHVSKSEDIDQNVNVVLITIDTLRADYLACYGNATIQTPHIDALANGGALFENAIVPMPLTNPSHTSILTGLYPGNHHVVRNEPIRLDNQFHTLADVLMDSGYKTAGFVSGYPLSKKISTIGERFELFEDDRSNFPPIPAQVFENTLTKNLKFVSQGRLGTYRLKSSFERNAKQTITPVKQWLNLNAQSTFFMWVHLYDPHEDYGPPAPFDTLYDPDYSGSVDGGWEALSIEEREQILTNSEDMNHMKALYAGEVSYVDEQVGDLLSELDRHGLSDRTLVVFTADHGECFTEHGVYFAHSECLSDASIKVPLIFRFPGGEHAGLRISKSVEVIDVFPTILDYLGLAVPNEIDGQIILDDIRNGSSVSSESPAVTAIFEGGNPTGIRGLSIRSDRYKYIWRSAFWAHLILLPETEAFYDLVNDPGETLNLIGQESGSEPVDKYRKMAMDYKEQWSSLRSSKDTKISQRDMEALRSLGYIK